MHAIDYTAVKKCLEKHFAPPGVEFEWQLKLHMALVSYPDPHRSCGWITSPLREYSRSGDVIHPQLRCGSGYETNMAQQKSAESLTGVCRMHGCECWPIELFHYGNRKTCKLEMARNHGVYLSTIQLKLLQEQPQTLDDVVTLATQLLEAVELVQRSLQATKSS